MLKIWQIPENYIWRTGSLKKVTILNTVTSVTVNSVMDIFLSVLQNFQDTAVFKTISKKPSSFGKCMYLKLTFFLYHNLIFRKKVELKMFHWFHETLPINTVYALLVKILHLEK